MTSRPLHVLVVEDNPDDAELLALRLRCGGYEVCARRVETAEEMRAALEEGEWDVVLSDYTVPGFGAPAALAVLQQAGLDLPFLIVSGTVGEEAAVEAMRNGVNDYLSKGNMARLLPAVERELREAANRRGRRQAEQAVRHLAAIVESSEDAIFSVDRHGTVLSWNQGAEQLYGCSEGEMVGNSIFPIVPPECLDEVRGLFARVGRGERVGVVETVRVRKDGARLHLLLTLSGVRDEAGRVVAIAGVARDVTHKKTVEETLVRDALLLANVRDAVIVTDLGGVITYWNEGATRIFGWAAHEMLGRPITDRIPPEGRAEMERVLRAVAEGQSFSGEWQDYHKDGSRIWIDARVDLLRDRAGQPVGLMGLSHDVTDRKRAEAERDQLLARLHLQIERMPLAYVLFAADFRIREWNAAAERIFGFRKEEALSMRVPFEKFVPTREWPQVNEVFRRVRSGDTMVHSVNDNLTRDGRTITCEWYNMPLLDAHGSFQGLLALALDITEKRSLEEQLRQAQKMEAIGQLAGGIAHDFNNLLTVINGYADLVLSCLPTGHPALELVGEMARAGERAAGLTRQLLVFSRKAILAPRVLDLNAVILEIEKMLRRVLGEDVTLLTRLQPALGLVRADPGHLEQVLLNLCVNARDAMPQGGKLTLETRNVDPDEGPVGPGAGNLKGPQILLAVSDTGCGIPADVLPRIFEPFFTTKEPGKGTGLGLATVHGIIHQSGGRIEVSSEPGRGTTFRVYLPRVAGVTSTGKSLPGIQAMPGGSETVLLVEDDDAVRALSRHVLASCGYQVQEAADSDQAVRVCWSHPGPIHLLATDVIMPGMGGRHLAEHLLEMHPEMKVLFVSGHTDDAVVRHGVLEDQVNFLQKPFSPMALACKVREVLDGR